MHVLVIWFHNYEKKTYLLQYILQHRIASLGTPWNMSNVLTIFTLRTGWCALESVDSEIKHMDN